MIELKKLLPSITQAHIDVYGPVLNDLLAQYEINTPLRLAMYFAQVGHESGDFSVQQESLYYTTPERIVDVWPSRFVIGVDSAGKKKNAVDYIRNEKKLANEVYGGRMGNNGPDDGYNFRGRSSMQITGKEAYAAYSQDTYADDRCVVNPDSLLQPVDYIRTSLWEWKKSNINKYADNKDIKGATKVINGGYVGLDDRTKRYNSCIQVLGV